MTPQPRRRLRGEQRREQIIDESLRVFAEQGYRNASTAEIAERCGLSQPGLWHYFPNKAALLTAVLAQRDLRDLERFAAGERLRGVGALRRLQVLVRANESVPGLVQLFTVVSGEAVTADHPAREWATRHYRALRDRLVEALREGIDDGELRADLDVAALAGQIVATIDGLQLQWLLDPERVDMAAFFDDYIEGLIARIRVEDSDDSGA